MAKHDKIKAIFGEYAKMANTVPYAEQEKYLLEKIEAYSAEEPDDKLGSCALHSQLGGLYRTYSKPEQGEAAFIKAKELLEESGDDKSYNYVTAVNNLAGLYYASRKYDQALELFDKSIAICENGNKVSLEAYSSALNNKGLILQDQGKYEDAEKLYKRALDAIKHMKENGKLLATTYCNLAFTRFAVGDKKSAVKYMDDAIALFEKGNISVKDPMYKQCMLIRTKMSV